MNLAMLYREMSADDKQALKELRTEEFVRTGTEPSLSDMLTAVTPGL
jgi:hypothetical protein